MSLGAVIAGVLAAIVALAGIFVAGKKSGKDAVRLNNAEAAVKDARRSDAIDNEVKSLSDADLDRELRAPDRK